MLPVDPLMAEHKLIERMIRQINRELARMQATRQANPKFIDVTTDFFRVYTDICHYGKEEHILFSELAAKPLLPEHRTIIGQLMKEHAFLRKVVKELINSKEQYEHGRQEALPDIERAMGIISTSYTKDIEEEEKHLFSPAMEYFSQKEQGDMLEAITQFDARIIHELYKEKVMQLEQGQM